MAERIVRLLTFADYREAKDQAQAHAQAEEAARFEAATACMRELNAKIAARETAKAERERKAFEAGHAAHAAAADEQKRARLERVAVGIEAVATSEKLLVRITTEAGTIYHMRREDWEQAQATGAINVPLCSEFGHQVQPSEKVQVRVSTVVKSELEPCAVSSADESNVEGFTLDQIKTDAPRAGRAGGSRRP